MTGCTLFKLVFLSLCLKANKLPSYAIYNFYCSQTPLYCIFGLRSFKFCLINKCDEKILINVARYTRYINTSEMKLLAQLYVHIQCICIKCTIY